MVNKSAAMIQTSTLVLLVQSNFTLVLPSDFGFAFRLRLDEAADGWGRQTIQGTALLFSAIRRDRMGQKNADAQQRDYCDNQLDHGTNQKN
jgi:hypothetical protein